MPTITTLVMAIYEYLFLYLYRKSPPVRCVVQHDWWTFCFLKNQYIVLQKRTPYQFTLYRQWASFSLYQSSSAFFIISCWSIKTSINFPTVINVVTLHFFSFAAISLSMMLSHFAYGVSSKK